MTKKYIFIGSMNEYGNRVGSLSEHHKPTGKLVNYAIGKLKVSEYGFQISKELNKVFIHLRPFYIYGPHQRKRSLINELFNSYLNNTLPEIGSCDYYRDYIHVDDVCEGIIKTYERVNISNIINLGSGSCIYLKDFVEKFWKQLR